MPRWGHWPALPSPQGCPQLGSAPAVASGAVSSCVQQCHGTGYLQELQGCWEEAQINNSGDRGVPMAVPVKMNLCVFDTLHCSPTTFGGCFPWV